LCVAREGVTQRWIRVIARFAASGSTLA